MWIEFQHAAKGRLGRLELPQDDQRPAQIEMRRRLVGILFHRTAMPLQSLLRPSGFQQGGTEPAVGIVEFRFVLDHLPVVHDRLSPNVPHGAGIEPD